MPPPLYPADDLATALAAHDLADHLRTGPRWLDAACARRNMGGRGGRRGGGGGRRAWTPNSDPDTVLWLDAPLSPRAENGGLIEQLGDLSRYGYSPTATGTARPTYNATDIGGEYASITYDGVGGAFDFLTTPTLAALAGATGITVFLVARDLTTGQEYLLEHSTNGGFNAGTFALITNIGNANSLSFYVCGNAGQNYWRSAVNSEDLVTPKIITCSADFAAPAGSEVAPIRINGVALSGAQTGTNNNTGTFSNQPLYIGARAAGAPSNMRNGALVVVKRALSDAEKLVFERYLGRRWGIPFADEMATRTPARILWIGQSNALPVVPTTTEINKWDGPHTNPRVWAYKEYYSGGTSSWVTKSWAGQQAYGLPGPDLVAAVRVMRASSLAPEIILCSRGSTSLAVDWQSAGNPYARLRDNTYPGAIGSHPSPPTSPVPWIVWIQGEADAANQAMSLAYGANLTDLFDRIGADMPEFAGCKKVVVQLHSSSAAGAYVANVRAAQQAYAAANPDTVFLVDPSDLALQGDGIHYTEATAIAMGKRIAAVIGAHS